MKLGAEAVALVLWILADLPEEAKTVVVGLWLKLGGEFAGVRGG